MDLLRFREKHTPQTECEPSQRVNPVAVKCGIVSFNRLENFICQ
jgi:desulfoferrodoxin (superoxide reductase-like protein)